MLARHVLSSEELMKLVQKGDAKAFQMIYERYKLPIYNYIRGIARHDHLAEELTHETFLKVFKNALYYEPTKKFSTWLWTVARNTALDELRRKDASFYTVDLAENFRGENPIDGLGDDATPIEEELIQRAQQQMLRDCLDALPANQREVLSLRLEEASYDEMANLMKSSVGAIKSLLHRARKGVMDCVKRKLGNEQ